MTHTTGRGFTLIELLVVVGIMGLIGAIFLANYNGFGGQVQLQNFAYDIALTTRQAQIYGIAVKSVAGTYAYGYGIHFDTASPNTVVLFADKTPLYGNGVYDTGELVSSISIKPGFGIADLCTKDPGSPDFVCGRGKLNLTFRRPESDAYIVYDTNSLAFAEDPATKNIKLQSGQIEEAAKIKLKSPKGDTRSVIVWSNGQITVE